MLERITSTILLKPAATEYAKRARYYRYRTVVGAIGQGILDHVNNDVQGVDVVDSTGGVEILIPGTDKSLQFMFDKNGIAFARVEGGKYYPITDTPQRSNLDRARENDKRAKSFLRRVFNRRFESLDRSLFELDVQTDKLSDSVLETLLSVHATLQSLNEQQLES